MIVSSVRLINHNNYYTGFGFRGKGQNSVMACTNPAENLSPVQKLYAIVSPMELKKYYDDACSYLNLDVKPEINLFPEYYKGRCGGFNFPKNQINFSIKDLTCSDYKVIGVTANKKVPLVDSNSYLPLIASKDILGNFLKKASESNNYGYNSIYIIPSTTKDKKRFILQKIVHELIHAQQHMILRQTEGIGEKEILKAWLHHTPKSSNDTQIRDILIEKFKTSFWCNKITKLPKISKYSPQGLLAYKWLSAIKNYPVSIATPEYYSNEIEKDAYKRSAEYVQSVFGSLET